MYPCWVLRVLQRSESLFGNYHKKQICESKVTAHYLYILFNFSHKLQKKGKVRNYQNKLGVTGERNRTYVPFDNLAPISKMVKRILKKNWKCEKHVGKRALTV